jgi:RNA polymerase sigma-70 factor (ECF subfamily)
MTTRLDAADLSRERTYLLGIAYRMLGSASDAEDVVQEALVRAADRSDLRSPRAFLTTVVTRLCLDELGSARRRRENYVGPDLPELLPTDRIDDGGAATERRETVSLALLVVLDQLSPLERAVFVLREVFDLEFGEIASALARSEAACRKLLQRARNHIECARTPPLAAAPVQSAIAQAFFRALASGDLPGLVELLADEATMKTDHGGKASAARRTLHGNLNVARFLHGLWLKAQRMTAPYRAEATLLNGAPALVLHGIGDVLESAFVLEISAQPGGAKISAVRAMRNPDKLRPLDRALRSGLRLPIDPRLLPASA